VFQKIVGPEITYASFEELIEKNQIDHDAVIKVVEEVGYP
jgi:hypothetical protein